jgi:hypothetical protein
MLASLSKSPIDRDRYAGSGIARDGECAMTLTTSRFRADVLVRFLVDLDGTDPVDAECRARRLTASRPGGASADIVKVDVRPLTADERLSRDNLRTWQEMEALDRGSSSQRQRWRAGNLAEEELLLLAREELFRPFALFQRRPRRGPAAISHPVNPDGTWQCVREGAVPISWATYPDPIDLDADQWQSVQRILRAMAEARRHAWLSSCLPTSVRCALREHRGVCGVCGRTASDASALIGIDWAGRLLSREYLL